MIRRLEDGVSVHTTDFLDTAARCRQLRAQRDLLDGTACMQAVFCATTKPVCAPEQPRGRNNGKNAGIIVVLYLPAYRLHTATAYCLSPPTASPPFLVPFPACTKNFGLSKTPHPESQPASSHLGSPSSPIERLADSRAQIAPWNGACGGFCSAPAPWLGVSPGPGPAPLKPEIIYGNLSKGVSVASRLSHLTEAVAGRNQCHMAAAGLASLVSLGWSAWPGDTPQLGALDDRSVGS